MFPAEGAVGTHGEHEMGGGKSDQIPSAFQHVALYFTPER
jgi:hypothetical protein